MISYLMGEKTKREHVTKGNLEGSTHQGKDHSLHQEKNSARSFTLTSSCTIATRSSAIW